MTLFLFFIGMCLLYLRETDAYEYDAYNNSCTLTM